VCGRFTLTADLALLEEVFALVEVPPMPPMVPRYNIAPTQPVAVVRRALQGAGPELTFMRWGLVPAWAKDIKIGNRMINARAETVAEKPSYRNAYKKRRCLILASGFYEWRKDADGKTPYYITTADNSSFAFAGLWERWENKESGEALQTTTIITVNANDFMQDLHHRMPIILQASGADRWLSGDDELIHNVAEITPPLKAWAVDRRVNNARHEGPELIEAVSL